MSIKLSEAVRLGTTLVPPIYGPVFKRNWRGCITGACRIGATALAAGFKPQRVDLDWSDAPQVMRFFRRTWPWTEQLKRGNNHLYWFGMASYIAYCHEVWKMSADEIATRVEILEAKYESSDVSPVEDQPTKEVPCQK